MQGLGHPEWIANTENGYIAKVIELAVDKNHLSEIRATLREQIERSPLRNETGFALKVEEAYRNMWKTCCEKAK